MKGEEETQSGNKNIQLGHRYRCLKKTRNKNEGITLCKE